MLGDLEGEGASLANGVVLLELENKRMPTAQPLAASASMAEYSRLISFNSSGGGTPFQDTHGYIIVTE